MVLLNLAARVSVGALCPMGYALRRSRGRHSAQDGGADLLAGGPMKAGECKKIALAEGY
jgi:hypothetical protein